MRRRLQLNLPLTLTRSEGYVRNLSRCGHHRDYVILSPANYYIVPEGTARKAELRRENDLRRQRLRRAPSAGWTPKPTSLSTRSTTYPRADPEQTVSGFAGVDDITKMMTFQNTNKDNPAQFGTVLFSATRAMGGVRRFSARAVACQFNDGIRAFFVMTFTGPGDGFTFSLLGAEANPSPGGLPNNNTTSVGGDVDWASYWVTPATAGPARTRRPRAPITPPAPNTVCKRPRWRSSSTATTTIRQLVYCKDAYTLTARPLRPGLFRHRQRRQGHRAVRLLGQPQPACGPRRTTPWIPRWTVLCVTRLFMTTTATTPRKPASQASGHTLLWVDSGNHPARQSRPGWDDLRGIWHIPKPLGSARAGPLFRRLEMAVPRPPPPRRETPTWIPSPWAAAATSL